MDECGQATEPEALIPISLTHGRIVLVGDQAQLGPVVMSPDAVNEGMDVSLFQRQADLKTIPFIRLNVQ